MTDTASTHRKKLTLPPDAVLDQLIHDSSPEILIAVAGDSRMSEDLALSLLSRRDLPREALEELGRNSAIARLRKVRLAVVMHPQTPRHLSVRTIRHLYVFELMQIALLPVVAADVKRAAEDVLINKLANISAGERFTLAKRSSGRVAAALLTDKEERTVQAALMNPQMTEAWIVRALKQDAGTELLAPAVSRHQKWFHRNDIKAALLGNKNTPFARVVQIAADLPLQALRDVLTHGRIAPNVKAYLSGMMNKRTGRNS
jgi:hypothetical protein